VDLSVEKIFRDIIPRPPFQRKGREGKREGGIRRNGRKVTGRKER
jgi:hypothetical protein